VFGENTEEGRSKFKSELEDLHLIFKDFVKENRPEIDTNIVATGEVWQGEKALSVGLIDEIGTSDDYLVKLSKRFKLFEIEYVEKKNLSERFALATEIFINKTFLKIYDSLNKSRFIS
jgi:serine protease SohB